MASGAYSQAEEALKRQYDDIERRNDEIVPQCNRFIAHSMLCTKRAGEWACRLLTLSCNEAEVDLKRARNALDQINGQCSYVGLYAQPTERRKATILAGVEAAELSPEEQAILNDFKAALDIQRLATMRSLRPKLLT